MKLIGFSTDENLDDQLFGQFQRCHDILGQMPLQAESREHFDFGGRVNEKGEMSYGFASNLRDALPGVRQAGGQSRGGDEAAQ